MDLLTEWFHLTLDPGNYPDEPEVALYWGLYWLWQTYCMYVHSMIAKGQNNFSKGQVSRILLFQEEMRLLLDIRPIPPSTLQLVRVGK